MLIIGIMTGTSLDGMDLALCDITRTGGRYRYELKKFASFPYPAVLKRKVLEMISDPVPVATVADFNFQYTAAVASAVNRFIDSVSTRREDIKALGFHGQTIWHSPPAKGKNTGSTLQLGNGPVLAKLTGITTVHDFRSADMALGGQGAPLVPIFDARFLAQKGRDVIALNIGGMANVTYLPASREKKIRAFDTGPGNVLIDTFMNSFYGKKYDNNGATARKGKIIPALAASLNETGFVSAPPPKSTGRELFSASFLARLLKGQKYAPEDIAFTLTDFTAESIMRNIREFCCASGLILVTGGGARNGFLVELLAQKAGGDFEVLDGAATGVDPDAKEAVCFAFLAYLTLKGKPGNIKEVTGASAETVLGSIALP